MAGIEDDTTLWGSQLADRGDELIRPGSRVGEHTILEAIASGGFGTVYRAEHRVLGRVVALKMLHADLASSPELVARFEREARAINAIEHPNVIDVFEFGRAGDRPYFVMEYLRGSNLGQHVDRRGPLESADIAQILEPLCSALAAAHARQIVHRDVTPSNVFLADENGQRRVVLLDFGIAKLLGDNVERLTTARQRVGTPRWMAPEQLAGGAVDARADVYTIGALIYFMLTGQIPFGDEPVELLLELHSHARRPRPSDVAYMPKAFDEVVVKAMAVEPADRFATIAELAQAFHGAGLLAAGVTGSIAGAGAGRGVGLHVELCVDAMALERAQDDLLAAMDDILAAADRFLRHRGFVVGAETGSSIFLVLPIGDAASDIESRRDAVSCARELRRMLDERDMTDERIHVAISMHVDGVVIAADKVRGGPLTRLAGWTEATPAQGIVGTSAVFDGLGLDDSLETVELGRFRMTG